MPSKLLGKRQWDSTWDGLPEEIRLRILEALMQNGCMLSRLATVSRGWQTEIERYNFAQIKLTPSRLAAFDSMTSRNRALVGCIWFCLELDHYDCYTCAPNSITLTPGQYVDAFSISNADNRPIAEAFRDLFAVLSTWEPNGDLKLDISIYSPSDSQHWFKYLTFMPDSSSTALGSGEIERTMLNETFHDPQHGWVAGSRHSAPPPAAILKVFHTVMREGPFYGNRLENQWWRRFPLVPAVTSLLLRQQNRRRWSPGSLANFLACFPSLQEIHYEPWREWNFTQIFTDLVSLTIRVLNLEYEDLFESIQGFSNTLRRLVVFENFNQQYPTSMQLPHNGIVRKCDSFRTPAPSVGRMIALASLRLEHLAASFIVDASHFFKVDADWEWPNLSSLVLTSKHLTPKEDPTEIGTMLQAAAAAAMKMPKLETMEIWNGRKGLAALFKYQANRKYREATITWRGTWKLTIGPSVIKAWEAVLHHYDGWRLNLVQERLDEAVIKSHGDAIHHLMLSSQVIRPVSLQQIRIEQKAMEDVEAV